MVRTQKPLRLLNNGELSLKLNDVAEYSVLSQLAKEVLDEVRNRLYRSSEFSNIVDSNLYVFSTQCMMDLSCCDARSFGIRQTISNWLADLSDKGNMPPDVNPSQMWEDMQTIIMDSELFKLLENNPPAILFVGAGPRGPVTRDNWAICIYPKGEKNGEDHAVITLTKTYPEKSDGTEL